MSEPTPNFIAQLDQPLIGMIVADGDREVVHYFTDEDEHAPDPASIRRARALAGAWKDLDWEEMEQSLDRIRHESRPTPSIVEL